MLQAATQRIDGLLVGLGGTQAPFKKGGIPYGIIHCFSSDRGRTMALRKRPDNLELIENDSLKNTGLVHGNMSLAVSFEGDKDDSHRTIKSLCQTFGGNDEPFQTKIEV